VRAEFLELVARAEPETFRLLDAGTDAAIAYARAAGDDALLVVGNLTDTPTAARVADAPFADGAVTDRLNGRTGRVDGGALRVDLGPWEGLVFTRSPGQAPFG